MQPAVHGVQFHDPLLGDCPTINREVNMVGRSLAAFFAVILSLTLGCQAKPARQATPSASAEWDMFIQQFMDSYFAANPAFAVYQGRHEFDGKLPDWSANSIKKTVERLKADRQKALMFNPAALDERQHFERNYLVAVIDRDLF